MSEKILDRIAKLLEQGNHPGTGAEEREAFFAKANALMHEHRISESMISARRASMGGTVAREPVVAQMNFIHESHEYSDLLYTKVAGPLSRLASIRMLRVTGLFDTHLTLFGYTDDIEYFRMLWTSAYLTFSTKLFPNWNVELSMDENVYNMAMAGIKWMDVWRAGTDAGVITFAPPGGGGSRLLKMAYNRHVIARGEEVRNHTQAHKAYRESYVVAFAWEIGVRVADLLARAETQTRATTGAELVLRSDWYKVRDLYDQNAKGATTVAFRRRYGNEINGERVGKAAGRETDLSGGKGHIQNRRGIGTGQRGLEG